MEVLSQKALGLLREMIRIPSFSRAEQPVVNLLQHFLEDEGVNCETHQNNLWARNLHFDDAKPTFLLNSHTDTVKPNPNYTLDPFDPVEQDGKLFGLGSNDAGGCLVSLIGTFLYFYQEKDLPFNLLLAATAEEEISGKGGIESILSKIGNIDGAIVGEPTEMAMAVAEKGLMVVDGKVIGKSGHAARDEGINAIYLALEDIDWIRNYQFEKVSPWLGPVKMSVNVIEAGNQHNVTPGECHYTMDIRPTDAYGSEELLEFLQQQLHAQLTARSFRLRPSFIPEDHPLSVAGKDLGLEQFGSATTSDMAVIPYPAIKMGPGRSERSHTPDEYIYIQEIDQGIIGYCELLSRVKF